MYLGLQLGSLSIAAEKSELPQVSSYTSSRQTSRKRSGSCPASGTPTICLMVYE